MNIPGKKILFTGVSGFVGRHLANKSRPDLELFGTYHRNPVDLPGVVTYALDITETEAFVDLLKEIQPDAVVHLAALSNPNYCENHPEKCKTINTSATFHLAGACRKSKVPFIFVSTDLVFDGKKPPYQETDATNGIMTYGKSKAEAEHLLHLMYPGEMTIARLPLMYGWSTDAPNFMTNWVQEMRKGNAIKAFTDEYRTTAWAGDVIDGLILLAEQGQKGIWHFGGPERQSRYEFAVQLAKQFKLDPALVIPVLQKDVEMAAARPADVSMDSQKATELGYDPKVAGEVLGKLALL